MTVRAWLRFLAASPNKHSPTAITTAATTTATSTLARCLQKSTSTFAPEPQASLSPEQVELLARVFDPPALEDREKKLLVITGAGISTEFPSSIPDYRSPKGSYSRGHKPLMYQDFIRSEANRQRYWARSVAGWKFTFRDAKPNAAHKALASLELSGRIGTIVTQNVDGLHQKGGSRNVIELHGTNRRVHCVSCGEPQLRDDFHARLLETNRWFESELIQELERQAALELDGEGSERRLRPDGDMVIPEDLYRALQVPGCWRCENGIVKPSVVFFGENVSEEIVEKAFAETYASRGVLVIGTSLAVYSSWRFVKAAHEHHLPITILNIGSTRADPVASLKIEARAAEILPLVCRSLGCEN